MYCEWEEDGEKTCGVRYEEVIALCVNEIQMLKNEVKQLKDQLQNK